jgi:hypothetical protein
MQDTHVRRHLLLQVTAGHGISLRRPGAVGKIAKLRYRIAAQSEATMAGTDGESASRDIQSEAMRHAGANNLPAAFSVLEASADAVDVSKNYSDFVKALYRDRKDVTQMLAAARAGVRYCLSAAEQAVLSERAVTLKTNARIIAFNAAANAWPGWGDEGIVIEKQHIAEATELALRSLQLVQELKLGPDRIGTAHWLIGALHLAASRGDQAIAELRLACDAYRAGANRRSELLALGYLGLARKRHHAPDFSPDELDEIYRQLQQDGSAEAIAFIQQLKTADRLLPDQLVL